MNKNIKNFKDFSITEVYNSDNLKRSYGHRDRNTEVLNKWEERQQSNALILSDKNARTETISVERTPIDSKLYFTGYAFENTGERWPFYDRYIEWKDGKLMGRRDRYNPSKEKNEIKMLELCFDIYFSVKAGDNKTDLGIVFTIPAYRDENKWKNFNIDFKNIEISGNINRGEDLPYYLKGSTKQEVRAFMDNVSMLLKKKIETERSSNDSVMQSLVITGERFDINKI